MKKTARMIAIALALGICLSSMPLAIAEEETSAVTETQVVEEKKEEKAEKHEEAKEEVKEEKHEEAKEEPKAEPEAEVKEEAEVEIEAEPEAEAETEVGTEPEAETEVETEEFVEIEDEETPLGLFDQQTPFTGSVKLERKGEGNLYFGDEVTLTANVQNANKLYEIRWEVNRQNEEGWTTISGENGTDYDFVLTQENANFEYRVVLVTEA